MFLKLKTIVKLALDVARGRENFEFFRFILAEMVSGFIYPKYKFSEFGRAFLEDKEFISLFKSLVRGENFHALDRKFVLSQLLNVVASVPGDTVECGVFEGASSYLICRRTRGLGKDHHVFDSFEGVSQPGDLDGSHWEKGSLSCGIDAVAGRLQEFPFARLYKGWIPARFGEVADRRFCFVHIDVDLYQPTADALKFFYERMSPGGLMLFDDYGFTTCPGARRAVDEFLADKKQVLVHLPTGQAFVFI